MMAENFSFVYNITGTDNEIITTTVQDDSGMPPPNRPSLTDILMLYSNYRLAVNLGLYGFPIIIGLGTIGNVLSFLIMIRRTMIITPTCFYMAILAISDTTVLYINCLQKWFFIKYGEQAWHLDTPGCRAVQFFSYSSFHFSVWITVAMTTERFFAIRYPLKFLIVGSVRKSKFVCFVILVLVSLLNCQFLWTVKINEDGNCVPEDDYATFHKDTIPWIDAVFYSFLPFALLITFNILIIYSFTKAHKRQKTLHGIRTNTKQNSNNRTSVKHRMTAMLLSVTFSFIIMTAPKAILFCIRNEVFKFLKYNLIDFEEIALYYLITRVADLCIYCNHSFNFLLYCVSGHKFRKELKLMFTCGKSQRASLSVYSSKGLHMSRYQTMQTISSNLGSVENGHDASGNHEGLYSRNACHERHQENSV